MRYLVQSRDLISIIIPIYNGEKYIRHIYSNIMHQTYRPIELILVNDGSTDQSRNLLDDILKKHDHDTLVRIKVLHKENGGIASARNIGLVEAIGKYVMFMDQDDWMEDDCVGTLADIASIHDADIVIGGFNKVNNEKKIEEIWSLNPQLSWSKFRITAPWGRLYKKAIIDKKKISFFNTKISEDLCFNILFLSYADKVEIVHYVGYNWWQNRNSESHSNWSRMSDDRNPVKVLIELHMRMGDSNLLKEDEMTFFFTKYLVWYLLFCSRGATCIQVKKRSEEIFLWLKDNYPHFSQYAWKGIMFPKGESIRIRLCVAGVLLMWKLRVLSPFLEIYRRF